MATRRTKYDLTQQAEDRLLGKWHADLWATRSLPHRATRRRLANWRSEVALAYRASCLAASGPVASRARYHQIASRATHRAAAWLLADRLGARWVGDVAAEPLVAIHPSDAAPTR